MGLSDSGAGDQVNRVAIFKKGNVGVLASMLFERGLDGPARGIGGMHHAAMGMATLPGQVELVLALF
jgi:hypothetical protein